MQIGLSYRIRHAGTACIALCVDRDMLVYPSGGRLVRVKNNVTRRSAHLAVAQLRALWGDEGMKLVDEYTRLRIEAEVIRTAPKPDVASVQNEIENKDAAFDGRYYYDYELEGILEEWP